MSTAESVMPATVAIESLVLEVGATRLLDSITLTVPAGSFVGICGPNGSGKSTLLRCVQRAAKPCQGVVLLDGTDVASIPPRRLARRVGVVLQERPDDLDFTVHEMVAMGRGPHRRLLDPFDDAERALVDRALARVGLTSLASRPFRTLSGGERQRVLVARALAQQTALLLLDEPTNHLDLRYQVEVLDLVRGLGITVIAALHDLQLAARFCDEVHLLANGRLVAGGPPARVLTSETLREVFRVDVAVHDVDGRLFFDYRPTGRAARPVLAPREIP